MSKSIVVAARAAALLLAALACGCSAIGSPTARADKQLDPLSVDPSLIGTRPDVRNPSGAVAAPPRSDARQGSPAS